MSAARTTGRQRGGIEQRGDTLRVSVYAGLDPVTGKRVYLRETVPGTDKAAEKRAEKALTRLLAQVDAQRVPETSVSLSHAIDEWMRVNEIEATTRHTYQGYIDRTIKPAIGSSPVKDITPRVLENFYAELRQCRIRCKGKAFIVHKTEHEHDCTADGCKAHLCRPMAAATVRQIHTIISGTMSTAERWQWITSNPARTAKQPRKKPPEPDPPSSSEAARLVEEAFRVDDDWGTLVWLVMTTGIRRGEACALRFSDIKGLDADLDSESGDVEGILEVRRNYVKVAGVSVEKATKTHQMRRIALDSETMTLLREHRDRVRDRLKAVDKQFTPNLFVFTGTRKDEDHSAPYSPNAVTQRYKDMGTRLGIDTHIHALRHYSATELLTAGVDLRTVAGRLGHGGGGATTLKVYAAWVAASDRKAAEILASRMPKRQRKPAS
ncbi:site-specific integrase [Kutzneria sp. NPDC051319]|uniref:tyrosine-type recombinase/integrase n=1 Tax=Kutzneria sp. NPDC051319 TaxID=3155047 RepID=UPI003424400F